MRQLTVLHISSSVVMEHLRSNTLFKRTSAESIFLITVWPAAFYMTTVSKTTDSFLWLFTFTYLFNNVAPPSCHTPTPLWLCLPDRLASKHEANCPEPSQPSLHRSPSCDSVACLKGFSSNYQSLIKESNYLQVPPIFHTELILIRKSSERGHRESSPYILRNHLCLTAVGNPLKAIN